MQKFSASYFKRVNGFLFVSRVEQPTDVTLRPTLPSVPYIPPIAVLVMACDRVTVSRSIDQLLG